MRNGVQKNDFGGSDGTRCDHGDRIDDWYSIEEGLGENVPDGGDVAIFDVDGTKEEGNAKGKAIVFEEKNWHEKPTPGGGDSIDESEDEDNDEVD